MKITNIPKGGIFAIDNNPKLEVGYIDIRDGIVNTNNLDYEATIMTMGETAEQFKVSMEDLEEILSSHEDRELAKEQKILEQHLFSPQDLKDLRAKTEQRVILDIANTTKLYEAKASKLADYPDSSLLEVSNQCLKTYLPKDPLDLSTMKDPTIHLIEQELKFRGITKPQGRYDEFHSIDVYHRGLVPRTLTVDQLDTYVSQETKAQLTEMFMPSNKDKYSFQLECKLLALFKDGKLTMAEVVQMSLDDCSI